jgi:hypothetical protein
MGMMFDDVTFENCAPSLSEICDKITSITSLPITVLESTSSELHLMDAQIAFESEPETDLRLLVYRPGAVAAFCNESFDDPALRSLMGRIVHGANEPANRQTVFLQGFLGQDTTLITAVHCALTSLGGIARRPVSDDARKECCRTITVAELAERHRIVDRQSRNRMWLVLLTLPVWLPLWIIACMWRLALMPFTMWKVVRTMRKWNPPDEKPVPPQD